MPTDRLRVEMELSAAEAAAYLEQIAAGLRNGAVQVKVNRREMWLRPEPTVTLEIQSQGRVDRGRLVLDMSWNSKFVAVPEEVQIGAGEQAGPADGRRPTGWGGYN